MEGSVGRSPTSPDAIDDLTRRRRKYLSKSADPNSDNKEKSEVLADLIHEVENERRGAFSLLSQHPLIAAVLLPSGGVGIWALLEYFANRLG